MNKVRIVTDSAAQFLDPTVVERYGIIVLPHTLAFSARRFREGIDLDLPDFFRRLNNGATPALVPPSMEDFRETYAALSRESSHILSIHMSQSMNNTCANARLAAQQLLGRCTVHILDSMITSVGLGIMVESAARLAEAGESLDSIARAVRRQAGHIFMMFYSESLDHLERSGVLSESHAVLAEMLGLRALLSIEDGQFVMIEKARTRAQAVEKLFEFVAEFNPADRLVIVQPHPSHDTTRMLQARLAEDLHWPSVQVVPYWPSLGVFLGADSIGVIIHQRIEA